MTAPAPIQATERRAVRWDNPVPMPCSARAIDRPPYARAICLELALWLEPRNDEVDAFWCEFHRQAEGLLIVHVSEIEEAAQ